MNLSVRLFVFLLPITGTTLLVSTFEIPAIARNRSGPGVAISARVAGARAAGARAAGAQPASTSQAGSSATRWSYVD